MTTGTASPILLADRIGKKFEGSHHQGSAALADVSLAVRAHEFVSVVGPSGCGKSTFLRIVAGLDHQSSGTIKVNGREISGPGADRGMVFQEYALLPWKTVLANVAFGLQLKKMPKAERERVARRYIDLVGLTGFEAQHPHQLSGGMRQRAAVARALANNPAILLMDEPFAAIDALTRKRLQEELTEICAVEKMTVLFVTHSVEEAIFLSDRVIVLSGCPGRVVSELPVDMKRPRRWETVLKEKQFSELRAALLSSLGHPSPVTEAQEHA